MTKQPTIYVNPEVLALEATILQHYAGAVRGKHTFRVGSEFFHSARAYADYLKATYPNLRGIWASTIQTHISALLRRNGHSAFSNRAERQHSDHVVVGERSSGTLGLKGRGPRGPKSMTKREAEALAKELANRYARPYHVVSLTKGIIGTACLETVRETRVTYKEL